MTVIILIHTLVASAGRRFGCDSKSFDRQLLARLFCGKDIPVSDCMLHAGCANAMPGKGPRGRPCCRGRRGNVLGTCTHRTIVRQMRRPFHIPRLEFLFDEQPRKPLAVDETERPRDDLPPLKNDRIDEAVSATYRPPLPLRSIRTTPAARSYARSYSALRVRLEMQGIAHALRDVSVIREMNCSQPHRESPRLLVAANRAGMRWHSPCEQ